MKTKTWTTLLAWLPFAGGTFTALAAPGAIGTTLSPASPITLGSTFTVTFTISGYTDATEIDGYNFHVAYPASLFSLVGGSLTINDAPGANPNWLRLPPQDGVGAGTILTDSTVTGAGIVDISVVDLRLSSTRGTTGASGFLYSFMLTATNLGSGSITPSAGPGSTVLYDVSLSPAGVPTFSSASITVVVPEPSQMFLILIGAGMLVFPRLRAVGTRNVGQASRLPGFVFLRLRSAGTRNPT